MQYIYDNKALDRISIFQEFRLRKLQAQSILNSVFAVLSIMFLAN